MQIEWERKRICELTISGRWMIDAKRCNPWYPFYMVEFFQLFTFRLEISFFSEFFWLSKFFSFLFAHALCQFFLSTRCLSTRCFIHSLFSPLVVLSIRCFIHSLQVASCFVAQNVDLHLFTACNQNHWKVKFRYSTTSLDVFFFRALLHRCCFWKSRVVSWFWVPTSAEKVLGNFQHSFLGQREPCLNGNLGRPRGG